MERTDATALLAEADHLQRRVHLDLGVLWFPLIVFGGFTLGGAVVVTAVSGLALAIYWALAGPLGGLATLAFMRQRVRSTGVEPRGTLAVITGLAIIGGAFLAYALGLRIDATFAAATPFMVVTAGYAVFARLDRQLRFAGVSLGLGLSATALGLSDLAPTTVSATLSTGYGAAFMLYGLTYRRLSRHAP